MNWFQRWLNKQIILTKIESILLKPDQLLVFYFKGIKTRDQINFVRELVKDSLKNTPIKENYIVTTAEHLVKIDVIEKEDVKPDGTIQNHPAILL